MPSPWVTRALNNDIPAMAYRGDVTHERVDVTTPFDEDAPIGTQDAWSDERDMHDEDISTFLDQNDRLGWRDEPMLVRGVR